MRRGRTVDVHESGLAAGLLGAFRGGGHEAGALRGACDALRRIRVNRHMLAVGELLFVFLLHLASLPSHSIVRRKAKLMQKKKAPVKSITGAFYLAVLIYN